VTITVTNMKRFTLALLGRQINVFQVKKLSHETSCAPTKGGVQLPKVSVAGIAVLVEMQQWEAHLVSSHAVRQWSLMLGCAYHAKGAEIVSLTRIEPFSVLNSSKRLMIGEP
jgi:hypothetical protein